MTKRYGKSATELQRWYLREWRKHRGLTQEQLAEAIDSTKQTVSRMEGGQTPYNQPFLEACAEAFDCSSYQLLYGPPDNDIDDQLTSKISSLSKAQREKISSIVDIMID